MLALGGDWLQGVIVRLKEEVFGFECLRRTRVTTTRREYTTHKGHLTEHSIHNMIAPLPHALHESDLRDDE